MENLSNALHRLADDAAAVAAARPFDGLEDDVLLAALAQLERVGRLVDGLRTAGAAELGDRCRPELGGDRLSARRGCRTGSELLQRVTLVSRVSADARLRLGAALRDGSTMTGATVPSRFPAVASAVSHGHVGVDTANAILRTLQPILDRAEPHGITAAQSELVAAACGRSAGADDDSDAGSRDEDSDTGTADHTTSTIPCTADQTRLQADIWRSLLDPDGAEPTEDAAMRRRGFLFGHQRDGVIPISGALMPEIAGTLRKLFDAHLSPKRVVAFGGATGSPSGLGSTDTESAGPPPAPKDPRFTAQQQHDALASIIGLAARAAESPTVAGAPPAVIVTVRQSDLDRASNGTGNGCGVAGASNSIGRTGVGHLDRETTPVSLRTIQHRICDGGTRQATLDDNGRIIGIGSPQRCFTPRQRTAITIRDGGCLIPSTWCEIHHVEPAANGGPTHTDNGVMLCWFHHRTIDTSGWQIRMQHGSPQIKAPPWLEPHSPWRHVTKSPTRLHDELEQRLVIPRDVALDGELRASARTG